MLKKLYLSFLLTLLGIGSLVAQDSKKVLFLGNSYTSVNNLPSMVKEMAVSTGDELVFDSNTPGGARLMDHASNTTSLNKIKAENWDYVVLQGQSQETAFPEGQLQNEVYPFAETLVDSIRSNNSCSQPLFYMTWGRENGDANNCPNAPWFCEYETMDSVIRKTYIFMAQENEALLAPAGAVWRNLRTNHPNIDLYSSDGSHPSAAGSYAAACAFYTMIYKKNPTLITWESTLSASDAETIRTAAKTVVFDSIENWDYTINPTEANFNESIINNEVSFTNTSAAYDSLVWDFGDGNTSTDDNPVHTYAQTGEYTVTLTVFKCGESDVKTKTIAVDVLGMNNFEKKQFSVYPNPVESELTLNFGKSVNNIQCKITNVTGRTILQKNHINKTKTSIDFSAYPKGVYFVEVVAEEEVFVRKVLKQ